MKQNLKKTCKNIPPHLSQNQKVNIRANTHAPVDSHAQNNSRQNYGCPWFVPSSASTISSAAIEKVSTDSLKADIYEKTTDVKNCSPEVQYATVSGASQSGPPAFFSPSRRKQSNFFKHLGDTIGASYPDALIEGVVAQCHFAKLNVHCFYIISLTPSSAHNIRISGSLAPNELPNQHEQGVHSGQQHDSERATPREGPKLTPMQHGCVRLGHLEPFKEGITSAFDHRCRTSEQNLALPICSILNTDVHDVGQQSSSHVMKEGVPPNRKRGRPSNNSKITHVQRSCLHSDAQLHASSVMHTPVQSLQPDAACFLSASQRHEKSIGPATRYVHQQDSIVGFNADVDTALHDAANGPSSNVVDQALRQPRKRGRPRNASTSARVCEWPDVHVASTHPIATPITEISNSHGNESRFFSFDCSLKCLLALFMDSFDCCFAHHGLGSTQPCKRARQTRQSSARCGDDHSQNIAEGSASHAPGNDSDLHATLDTTLHDTDVDPSSNIAQATLRQTRKRGRPRNAYVHATSPNPVGATITGMTNSYVAESARRPCKRARRARQCSAPCRDDHSENIGEGSTSHAPDNTSPMYDDLGDCTERCIYCNAAFWRGERLADPEIVEGLIHFLDAHNELVQIFRTARDKCAEADVPEFKIRLYSGEGPRGYEPPSSNTLGAIVFDRGPESESNYDVILEYRDGPLKRISKLHKSYMSLQFPLIFIYGQPGFHTKLMLRTANPDDEPKRVSMNAFYTYQLHPKHDSTMEENTQPLVQLPCQKKEIQQAKELYQHGLQMPDNMLIEDPKTSDQETHKDKKFKDTSKGPVKFPDKEAEQGKELHKAKLDTPEKMLIGTQESSGTTTESNKSSC
ncbi:hypothetical protein CTI12_AA452770 [Artemisia annua]|uniref:Helitron helicase-like domain-containing protein n=1 Tax=Artemisia annua TaxID=35608 RepID=A0A2U1LU94_ARTAN|nr:hypothetical protein CTI12_AA452770 [Artemisia annua]